MLDPDLIYNGSIDAAEDWADKDHASGILEDALGTLESQIASELKAKGEPVSIISKLIKKDSRWIEFARTWRDAKKASLLARLKYDQLCRKGENIRTNAVTERQLTK